MIPLSVVKIGEAEEQAVLQVLRSGMLTQGDFVARLEDAFGPIAGTAHVIAVNNGTSALVAALRVLGVGAGDEVITSPFTFAATVNAILATGATARLVDIESDFTIGADAIGRAVTPRTKAIMPVHLYGQMADMPAIAQLAADAGVAIIEDAAQAHGAAVEGRPAGSFGLGCFSLYATKNLYAGEGGLITTDDESVAERLRILRNQGMRGRYEYVMPGDNLRLSDVHAAIALPQVAMLEARTQQRCENAQRLLQGLAGIGGIVLPMEVPGRRHVWHQFTIRVTPSASLSRDALATSLAGAGVGAGVYYPLAIPEYECYRNHPNVAFDDVPNAVTAAREVLSLPVHPWLSSSDLDHIIESTQRAFDA